LKCRSCRNGRHTPPVSMVKLTATREITPYPGCIQTRKDSSNVGLVPNKVVQRVVGKVAMTMRTDRRYAHHLCHGT
jgi:hypothetical protein